MFSFLFIRFRELLIHSWWMIAFLLVCTILYEQSLQQREETYQQLHKQQENLKEKKQVALEEQQTLLRKIHSQHDRSWMELTLMKEMGLVPEGQKKVYFYSDSPCTDE